MSEQPNVPENDPAQTVPDEGESTHPDESGDELGNESPDE